MAARRWPRLLAGSAQIIAAACAVVPVAAQVESAIVRSARGAQAEFERTRRSNLPHEAATGGPRPRCDLVIGRFCYWNDESEDDPPPPEEHPRVIAARQRLLRTLDSVSALDPANAWIAGQRVRYLIEAARFDDANHAARECRSDRWWCEALKGLAAHASARFADADSLFQASLAAMPDAQRCSWRDVSVLLDEPIRSAYRRQACEERQPTEDRLWWLADPLYSTPGNERRAEHYARETMDALQDGIASAYGLAWAPDLSELLMRFGWPTYWAEALPSGVNSITRDILAHHQAPSYHFVPSAAAMGDPTSADADDWSISPTGARELYGPGYGTFRVLSHQAAMFPRRDSALLVAAFDVRQDSVLSQLPVDAWLFAAPDAHASQTTARAAGLRGRGALAMTVSRAPQLVSVEAVARGIRAARARFGMRLPSSDGRVALSDILVIDGTDSLPTSLEAAMARARGSTRVGLADPVSIFWETHGLQPGEVASVSLSASPVGVSTLRRFAQALRLVNRSASLRVRWTEQRDPTAGVGRAVALDLSPLRAGRYEIELRVSVAGAPTAITRRQIDITR